jgi:hypothetical protein
LVFGGYPGRDGRSELPVGICRPVNAINTVGAYDVVGVNETRAELAGNLLV